MSRAAAVTVLLLAAGAGPLAAQTVRVGVFGVLGSYSETDEVSRSEGAGVGGSLVLRIGRFGLDASGYRASLDPESPDDAPFDVLQGDVRVSVALRPQVALEVGVGRRTMDPDFAAQDVGFVRAGLLSENHLTRVGIVWVRAAYLISPQFDGGGDAGLALELGLGAALGSANGRFRVRTDYEFQRIDRTVGQVDVPIQLSLARLGIEVGF